MTNATKPINAFASLEVIRTKYEEYKAKFVSEAKEEFTKSFKEVFETYPEILSIKWQQYAPYFNDGEECVFRVHDCNYTFEGLEDDLELCGGISVWDTEGNPELSKYLYLNPILNLIDKNIGSTSFEEVMQEMFGNHVEVTVTKEGIQVDEYYHD